MVDREHIINFLRINNISPSASEDAIEEALRIARWRDEDIRTALLKLNNDTDEKRPMEHNPHNLFFSNVAVAPETLSSLLGIDIAVTHANHFPGDRDSTEYAAYSKMVIVLTILCSVILGVFATLFIMYIYDIGPFYSPIESYGF